MDLQLTKDADKMICCVYREYLQRRKLGLSVAESCIFKAEYFQNDPVLSAWNPDDCMTTAEELDRAGLFKVWISGDFEITSDAIFYMENRFKNGILELADFISKFKP